jgi:hypothetical protein
VVPGRQAQSALSPPDRQQGSSPRQANGDRPLATAPLKAVVTDAVRRWFLDAQKEAMKGDVVRTFFCFNVLWVHMYRQEGLQKEVVDEEVGCGIVSRGQGCAIQLCIFLQWAARFPLQNSGVQRPTTVDEPR